MQIANIYPIANQTFYQYESMAMILAHLVKKNLYSSENFSQYQFIIMDNGLFEGEQVSTVLADCVDLACKSGIPVCEIIIPDAINDLKKTQQLFLDNLDTIKRWQHRFKFMFVAQAKTYGELHKAITFINQYKDLNLSVGISKLTPLNRAHKLAIRCYKECKLPIHFLGIKSTLAELTNEVQPLIRSCDTSQLAFIAKNEFDIESVISKSILNYVRKGEDIDLESDACSSAKLARLKRQLTVAWEEQEKHNEFL